MYIYVYIYVYVCKHIYICIYTYIYIHTYKNASSCAASRPTPHVHMDLLHASAITMHRGRTCIVQHMIYAGRAQYKLLRPTCKPSFLFQANMRFSAQQALSNNLPKAYELQIPISFTDSNLDFSMISSLKITKPVSRVCSGRHGSNAQNCKNHPYMPPTSKPASHQM